MRFTVRLEIAKLETSSKINHTQKWKWSIDSTHPDIHIHIYGCMYFNKEILLVSTALRLQVNEELRRGSWICFRLGVREIPNASYSANPAQDTLQRPPCRHGYQESYNLYTIAARTHRFISSLLLYLYTYGVVDDDDDEFVIRGERSLVTKIRNSQQCLAFRAVTKNFNMPIIRILWIFKR